ncbi:MAG TPA: hypothetical protein VMD91_10900 [Candidatus Sulfotelmatobacter sp.]|nr:hypothetical protein [Candidatus Sulfotelmatobacter sp.]
MKRFLSAAVLAAMLAGCGGGGGHALVPSSTGSGNNVSVPNSKGHATVVASAKIAAATLPHVYDRKVAASKRTTIAKVKAASSQIASVEVDGTLYQGSASAVPVTNTQNVPLASDGTITVSETFSNVVPANNDWVVFAFYTVAGDGSKNAIGSLGTFVNVGSGTTDTNLSAASTQTLQVAAGLLQLGALSTYDIENDTTLASDLAAKIAAQGATVNSQTGVYDNNTLVTLLTSLVTAYERDLTITAANATEFSVVYDSSQPDENDLAYNAFTAASALGLPNLLTGSGSNPALSGVQGSSLSVIGAPLNVNCSQNYDDNPCTTSAGSVPLHSPSSGYSDAQPSYVQATMIEASGTVTIKNVYGGHLVIGAHNGLDGNDSSASAKVRRGSASVGRTAAAARHTTDVTTQAYGATQAIAGEAPGPIAQTLTLQNTLVGASTTYPQVIDAQAAAFGGGNTGYYYFQPTALANAAGNVPIYVIDCIGNTCDTQGLVDYDGGTDTSLSPPGANNAETMLVDGWNAFGLTPANISICSETNCSPLTGTSPISVQAAFDDPGTNIAVYGWAAGTGTQSVAAATTSPCPWCGTQAAYGVTYAIPAGNTGSTTGAVTGSDTENLQPWVPARAYVYLDMASIPSNMTMTLQLTDSNGNTYSATNTNDEQTTFAFSSIAQPIVVKSFSLTYTIPAADVQNGGNPATTGTFYIEGMSAGDYFTQYFSGDCC